ncbi:MAG: hypothetical protein FJW26_22220 [Acidimicrobiia bacterium]|nr:hypothetical protein [Acidimicrobiia bacterium]
MAKSDYAEPYDRRSLGRGQLAVAREDWQDPYVAAQEIHILMSRSRDVLRMFNAAGMNCVYGAAGPSSAVVQLLDYDLGPQPHPATLWLKRSYRAARLWTLNRKLPQPS